MIELKGQSYQVLLKVPTCDLELRVGIV